MCSAGMTFSARRQFYGLRCLKQPFEFKSSTSLSFRSSGTLAASGPFCIWHFTLLSNSCACNRASSRRFCSTSFQEVSQAEGRGFGNAAELSNDLVSGVTQCGPVAPGSERAPGAAQPLPALAVALPDRYGDALMGSETRHVMSAPAHSAARRRALTQGSRPAEAAKLKEETSRRYV